ncbi:MAG: hypothetical protein ACI9I0_001906 [Rhodoferax sp.]|jgi:hypothetical protein
MKTKFATTALILASGLIASTSFAANNAPLTRAGVMADYYSAKAAGNLPVLGESDSFGIAAAQRNVTLSTLTRATVKTDLNAAKTAGNLPLIGERAQMATAPTGANSLTRQAVMTEYAMAKAAGNLPAIGESNNMFMQNIANSQLTSTLTAGRTNTEKTGS